MIYGLRGWIGKLLPRGPFYCNLCGYKGSVWLWRGHENEATRNYEIIGAGRRKCDCFACGSSDRDRSVFHFLNSEITDFSNQRILHVAPERQLNFQLKSLGAEVINIDARKSGYLFSYGLETKTADLTALPFTDQSFDWIIANHVLEHIENEYKALSEIKRVLKPNGKAILMVPMANKLETTIEAKENWSKSERISFLGQKDHVRLYGTDLVIRWAKVFDYVKLIPIQTPVNLKLFNDEKIILVGK